MQRYKKTQTTSTKCQYQAAASNPKWWPVEKWWRMVRARQTARKVVPIITWRPWNPVATKKTDPYTLSAMVKVAQWYSSSWRAVKYTPRQMVRNSAHSASRRDPSIKAWCAYVTVTPEASKTPVLRRGIENGLIGVIPAGGQVQPISGVGASLLWKKAQKNEKKNITSEIINNTIPHRSPLATGIVWRPK